MNKNLKPYFYCYLLERFAVNKLRGRKMNKTYRSDNCFYLRFSRSFTKRDKYACSALYHSYSLNRDYRIFYKNLKGKRLAIYFIR